MQTLKIAKEELTKSLELEEGQRYLITVRPKAVVLRFSGVLFDTNKNFLLPGTLPHLRQLTRIYKERPDNKLLIVGHTDTSGDVEYNDVLSLERARAVQAFLERDVAAWLERYEPSVPAAKRWGSAEDSLMLHALPVGDADEADPIRQFQASRGLEVDGITGPQTRTALIEEYMALPGLELPEEMSITVHGCGEHFPLDGSGLELDTAPADDQHDALDRRVELFFFDKAITPPPPGENSSKTSTEYKEWRKLAQLFFEHTLGPSPALRVRFEFNGEPAANEPYELRVDGHLFAVSQTTSDGQVDQVVPHNAKSVRVTFTKLGLSRTLELQAAEQFPSVDSVEGVQIRLNQLGFFAGNPDGVLSETTQLALAAFKRSRGLPDDSTLDDATRQALQKAYGS